MNNEAFADVVRERLDKCRQVLVYKGIEYSSSEDRFHNFKAAAALDNESPEKSLWGMWKKHIVSVRDLIDSLEKDRTYVPSKGLVQEKLGDNINYCLLLEGLIEERRAKSKDWIEPVVNHSTEQALDDEDKDLLDEKAKDVAYRIMQERLQEAASSNQKVSTLNYLIINNYNWLKEEPVDTILSQLGLPASYECKIKELLRTGRLFQGG